jgi:hypothetical protein
MQNVVKYLHWIHLKVWWPYAPLFIFSVETYSNRLITYEYITIVVAHSDFFTNATQKRDLQRGAAPGRDSNQGRRTYYTYYLSYAATYTGYVSP